jgi:transposase
MQQIHPVAVFRLSVLGSLTCREHLENGELKRIIKELATYSYIMPFSNKTRLGVKTIEHWYYLWKHGGIDALTPKKRCDCGVSKIPAHIGEEIIRLKKDDAQLTIEGIIHYLLNEKLAHSEDVSRSSVHRLLRQHGLSRSHKSDDPDQLKYEKWKVGPCAHETWIKELMQGKLLLIDLLDQLSGILPGNDIELLYDCVLTKPLRYRNRSICVLSVFKGIPKNIIINQLCIAPSTLDNTLNHYNSHGAVAMISDLRNKTLKHEEQEYIDKVFSILHAPPSSYGFNRTTWRLDDLGVAMEREGMPMGKGGIAKIIKNAGYTYRKAKVTLTSNDPDYQEKLKYITGILSNLKSSEKFFSIDEYGPFAVKMQGGKSLVPPGTQKTVPQWQKSKGSLILTAALELSTNQVTHFYSEKKNTQEMIKLLKMLMEVYSEEEVIYFSWDAASWHASKELYRVVDEVNSTEKNNGNGSCPKIVLAPLPTCAQFLNVIESVFSGMARAIIHNSNYQSIDECKAAIDKYFLERNQRYLENPKRAGNKIWGKERVKAVFSDSNNCKDKKYR